MGAAKDREIRMLRDEVDILKDRAVRAGRLEERVRRMQSKLEATQREAKALKTHREENASLSSRFADLEVRLRDALADAAHEKAERQEMAEDATTARARVRQLEESLRDRAVELAALRAEKELRNGGDAAAAAVTTSGASPFARAAQASGRRRRMRVHSFNGDDAPRSPSSSASELSGRSPRGVSLADAVDINTLKSLEAEVRRLRLREEGAVRVGDDRVSMVCEDLAATAARDTASRDALAQALEEAETQAQLGMSRLRQVQREALATLRQNYESRQQASEARNRDVLREFREDHRAAVAQVVAEYDRKCAELCVQRDEYAADADYSNQRCVMLERELASVLALQGIESKARELKKRKNKKKKKKKRREEE